MALSTRKGNSLQFLRSIRLVFALFNLDPPLTHRSVYQAWPPKVGGSIAFLVRAGVKGTVLISRPG